MTTEDLERVIRSLAGRHPDAFYEPERNRYWDLTRGWCVASTGAEVCRGSLFAKVLNDLGGSYPTMREAMSREGYEDFFSSLQWQGLIHELTVWFKVEFVFTGGSVKNWLDVVQEAESGGLTWSQAVAKADRVILGD